MKKKICFFSSDMTTERVAMWLANALAMSNEYEVFILSLAKQKETSFFKLDQRIHDLVLGGNRNIPHIRYIEIVSKLRNILKKERFDVIISLEMDILMTFCSVGLKTKIVSWKPFSIELERLGEGRKWIYQFVATHSDHTVVSTRQDCDAYERLLKRTDKTTCIYNPQIMPEKMILPIEKRKKQIVTVARSVVKREQEDLLQLILEVLKENSEWQWVILGNKEEQFFFDQEIQKNGLKGQVLFVGEETNMHSYLRESSFFVLVSHYKGCDSCLLEALTRGVPCIGFDTEIGSDEIIRDGDNGYLVRKSLPGEMKDLVNALIKNPKRLEDLIEGTQMGMEMFSEIYIWKQWRYLLKTVLEQ